MVLAVLGAIQLCLSSSTNALQVFYVKPTVPRTECLSGDSPCHSLQYYANHSNFTSNSRFLFLEGEHHLDSAVTISNVVNLSLVGASPGVEILCVSPQHGLLVKDFTGLNISNLTISYCSGLYLVLGSEVRLDYVALSNTFGVGGTAGLMAIDVVGLLSISDCTFLAAQGDNIIVNYITCNRPSHFKFSSNKLGTSNAYGALLLMSINCSNVEILVANSAFKNDNSFGLTAQFSVLTTNSIQIENSRFTGARILLSTCTEDCDEDKLQCSRNYCIKLTRVITDAQVAIQIPFASKNTALIKDSVISNYKKQIETQVFFSSTYDTGQNLNDTFAQATLLNVTIANEIMEILQPVSFLYNVAVLFANCTFENNTGSVLQTFGATMIFQGHNSFRNNSAILGATIQTGSSSCMYLHAAPHVHTIRRQSRRLCWWGHIQRTQKSMLFLRGFVNIYRNH